MFSFLDSQTTNSNENIIQCQGNQSFRTNRPRFLEAKGRSRDAPPLDHSPPQRFPHVKKKKKEQPQMVQRATGSPKNSYPVSFPTKEGPILRFLSATKVILKNAERIWPCKLDHLAPHPQTSYYEYGNGVVFRLPACSVRLRTFRFISTLSLGSCSWRPLISAPVPVRNCVAASPHANHGPKTMRANESEVQWGTIYLNNL